MTAEPEGSVLVARLGKTRGLKGEIYAAGDTATPERFLRYGELTARKPGFERSLRIVSAREYKGRLVFTFAGVDSIGAAEPLEGAELYAARESRPALADGAIYFADLVGCEVLDRRGGRKLGRVSGWQECGGPPLIEIDAGAGEPVLIPFAREIFVVLDLERRVVEIDPPEGLLDLNQR